MDKSAATKKRSFIFLLATFLTFAGMSPALAVPNKPGDVRVANASTSGTATDAAKVDVSWNPSVVDSSHRAAQAYQVIASAAGQNSVSAVLTGFSSSATRLSIVLTGLTGGINYKFTVTAQDAVDGTTAVSDEVNFRAQSVPAPPAVAEPVAAVDAVTLSWTKDPNEGGLNVTKYKITTDDGKVSEEVAGTETSVQIKGLTGGTTYKFSIVAVNALGDSTKVNFSDVRVIGKPGAPTSVSAQPSGSNVEVSWTTPSDDGGGAITSYKIYFTNSSGTEVTSLTTSATSSPKTVNNVPDGSYSVKVTASNVAGESVKSSASQDFTLTTQGSGLDNNITFDPSPISDQIIDTPLRVTARSDSGKATISATPESICEFTPQDSGDNRNTGFVSMIGAGECTLDAVVPASGNYKEGRQNIKFKVLKKSQSITFASIANKVGSGSLTLSATASSNLTVAFSATGNCSIFQSTLNYTAPGSCTVTATQTGDTKWDAAPAVPRSFTITAPAPSGGSDVIGGGGGGGGGGGAVKQTALYFKIVDPADNSKVWSKRGCVSVYSRDLFPQFMGSGCSDESGNINLLVGDAKVSVRVYENGYGDKYRVYLGEVGNDTFTLDANYFPGTTRYAVSVLSDTPTPTPTPTPSPTPTPTPVPTQPTRVLIPKNSYVAISSSGALLTLKSNSTALKLNRSFRFSWQKLAKRSTVLLTVVTPKSSYTLPKSTLKSTTYTAPALKFLKAGSYKLRLKVGKTTKTFTIQVRK